MRVSLLHLLACPYCGEALGIQKITEQKAEEIWSGSLRCTRCKQSFEVRRGMPFVYRHDESWVSKAREAEGWVRLHKERGIYEPGEEAIDLRIPYVEEGPWPHVRQRFDEALRELSLTGSEVVLDLGAGRGWAAKQFALLGCETVGLDVTDDENIGLGRGRALMEAAGTVFERVIGDGENLPFRQSSFDVVFCSAALHHARNLPLLLRNAQRVLKSGGRLCAISEPWLSIVHDEHEELGRNAVEEIAAGINETIPTYQAYHAALRGADLIPTQVVPAASLSMRDAEVQDWARDLGAVWAWPDLRDWRRSVNRLKEYGKLRVWALRQGKPLATRGDGGIDPRDRALNAVARWCTGELFLMAEKRA